MYCSNALHASRPSASSVRHACCHGYVSADVHAVRAAVQARRREIMRQERMEAEAREKDLDAAYEAKQTALREQEEARTAKRRAKRLKKKVGACCITPLLCAASPIGQL